VTLDDTFSVTRDPQDDNFDANVFDLDGNAIVTDGALEGAVISFPGSATVGPLERAVIDQFFGGVQDDTSSIFLGNDFSAAPQLGDFFEVQIMAPGMGPSTFRIETVDVDGTGLEDGFEFPGIGFVLDNVDIFAPFDQYGLPLGEAAGVGGVNEGLPFGWTPILPPETIDFSNFPAIFIGP
jgi:hypothetical protein